MVCNDLNCEFKSFFSRIIGIIIFDIWSTTHYLNIHIHHGHSVWQNVTLIPCAYSSKLHTLWLKWNSCIQLVLYYYRNICHTSSNFHTRNSKLENGSSVEPQAGKKTIQQDEGEIHDVIVNEETTNNGWQYYTNIEYDNSQSVDTHACGVW